MEGLLFTAAVLVALVVAVYLARSRRARTRSQSRQGRRQEVDPPGQRSAPDEWPRDGGDNPRAP